MSKLSLAALAVALIPVTPAFAQHHADETMRLVDTIDVGGNGLGAFDISFVDPRRGLYVLADRTNASVDFFNPRDDKFVTRVTGFKGVVLVAGKAVNGLSGPDGVAVIGGKEVWAGDGDSTVKVINIGQLKIVDTISTGGKFRCDEMAWDSADHILAVANNADTPPFITLISTDPGHKILGKITFDGTSGTPNATTTGIEQAAWSSKTGLFYVSVPQIDPSNAASGGISVIDPISMTVNTTYPVTNCSPAGLTLGPDHQALIGCSASFPTTGGTVTQSVAIDIRSGAVLKQFPKVGGSDEVWYDAGTHHYYLAARNNLDSAGKPDPILGTIDADTLTFDGGTPTSTSAHSVAADAVSHHVFVPIGFPAAGASDPTNPCPVVSKGCIAVYKPSSIDHERDHDHDQDDRKHDF